MNKGIICEDCNKLTGGFCQKHSYKGEGVIEVDEKKVQPITQNDLDAIKGRIGEMYSWFSEETIEKIITSQTISLLISKVNEIIKARA